ncbi:MAG: DUF4340 domain-containing protein, partial [Clostridiales bacterium]|nr:DUF4340 domain-containing protein [Clostridiales bacterium]
LGDLVELNAADNLSEYGLDAPSLELRFSSAESDTHILFGDRINEDGAEKIYCQFAGSDQVYKADYESVQIMYGLNPLPFINRFIALTDIKECAAVDFDFPGDPERNVRITLEHGTAPPKEGEETGTDFINATVNGQAVEEEAFRTFYRLIIGLIFDADIGEYAPGEGSRALSLTYTMTDGSRNVIHFYPYDNSFYAVETEGEPIRFVISRRTVELIFDALPGLLGE